ncbi:uncharacterized protein LOC114352569 [Ostrinia furnacalis]|uniref:uncharacterized protein LOC114352569 n=1 Tax=Ostrinia furnacalis TaxID=93504 RepID=UPI00103DA7ED|nr:uncharacterized protein LOC114352569 [Ostrinia furnacalis]
MSVTDTDLPSDWPCEWSEGTIPFVFDFFSVNPKRLRSLVRKGHEFLQKRSCLTFIEHNPVLMAQQLNTTYLYYTYSGVLESCCLHYYFKPVGRRMILITPTCTLPPEVAHVTLHGMGLDHRKREPFQESRVRAALFPTYCSNIEGKVENFGKL